VIQLFHGGSTHDEAGRLISAVSGTDAVVYEYDGVGNLMSITRETAYTPSLLTVSPDVFLVGETYNVTLTGQHLATTVSLTADNPNITITNVSAANATINAVLSVAKINRVGSAIDIGQPLVDLWSLLSRLLLKTIAKILSHVKG